MGLFLGILEKKLLNESASAENVTRAMDNHSKVIINYHSDGKDAHSGARVIEPVAYGLTKTGNPVIRAYQPYGDTTTKTPGWKFFRLDRISYWEETSQKFGDIPDFSDKNLNPDGDNTMSTVIKTYNSTETIDGVNGVNVGPKTKEKVNAETNIKTSGDNMLDLGRRNLERMRNGIKIDLDNNKKVGNAFNITTSKQQNTANNTSGPRFPEQKTLSQQNTNGSVENGDIDKQELENAREMVYNDYAHEMTQDDIDNFDAVKTDNERNALNANKQKDKRWNNSTDSRFLNRKDSLNRVLYNQEDSEDNE